MNRQCRFSLWELDWDGLAIVRSDEDCPCGNTRPHGHQPDEEVRTDRVDHKAAVVVRFYPGEEQLRVFPDQDRSSHRLKRQDIRGLRNRFRQSRATSLVIAPERVRSNPYTSRGVSFGVNEPAPDRHSPRQRKRHVDAARFRPFQCIAKCRDETESLATRVQPRRRRTDRFVQRHSKTALVVGSGQLPDRFGVSELSGHDRTGNRLPLLVDHAAGQFVGRLCPMRREAPSTRVPRRTAADERRRARAGRKT